MSKRKFLASLVLTAGIAAASCSSPDVSAGGATMPAGTAGGSTGVAIPAMSLTTQPSNELAAGSPVAAAMNKFNLNTATDEQLLSIPNSGQRMLREFKEYRPYLSIAQFRREIGKYVSAEQVAAYEQYLFVPIDPNQADAGTLQQIPGIDATEAAQLIAGRPYSSSTEFVSAVSQLVSPDQLATATGYLAGS